MFLDGDLSFELGKTNENVLHVSLEEPNLPVVRNERLAEFHYGLYSVLD